MSGHERSGGLGGSFGEPENSAGGSGYAENEIPKGIFSEGFRTRGVLDDSGQRAWITKTNPEQTFPEAGSLLAAGS